LAETIGTASVEEPLTTETGIRLCRTTPEWLVTCAAHREVEEVDQSKIVLAFTSADGLSAWSGIQDLFLKPGGTQAELDVSGVAG
jgi:hypothetical protein